MKRFITAATLIGLGANPIVALVVGLAAGPMIVDMIEEQVRKL